MAVQLGDAKLSGEHCRMVWGWGKSVHRRSVTIHTLIGARAVSGQQGDYMFLDTLLKGSKASGGEAVRQPVENHHNTSEGPSISP